MRRCAALAALCLLGGGPSAACSDPENSLSGSLASQYDLSFDRTRARQFLRSRQLLVEYVRGDPAAEEKPIMVSVRPTPAGPGLYLHDDGGVSVDNSLLPGRPDLPEMTSATLELEVFTPDLEGSTVQGSLNAMFTNAGTGDSFSLQGRFLTQLEIVQ